MNHDAMGQAMFWVGALFVFTPLVVAGLVIGIWLWGRRKEKMSSEQRTANGELRRTANSE